MFCFVFDYHVWMISVDVVDSLGKDVINNRLFSIVLPGADVSHQVAHTRLQLLEVHLKTKLSRPVTPVSFLVLSYWLLNV